MLSERLLDSAVAESDAVPVSPKRVELLDNAKAVLIVCVVLYHTLVVYTTADREEAPIAVVSGILALLKAVVMPCFCLISGHLSPTTINARRMRGLFQLLTTYLVFQFLNWLNLLISYRLNGFPFEQWPVHLFHPETPVVTWFLLALLIWRLAMLLLSRTRAPIAISLAISLGALFVDLGVNYQNIASFFPYFVVGYRLPRSVWRRHLLRPALRVPFAACFLAAAAAVLIYSAIGEARFGRTFGRFSYTYACFNGYPPGNVPFPAGCASGRELAFRAAFYLCSAPLILGFLCVLPTRSSLWTVPGYMSMYVYLLHPFVLFNPAVMKVIFDLLSRLYGHEVNVWSPAKDGTAVALLVPGALLVCAALSTPATRWLLWPLVEPPVSCLFQRDAETEDAESRAGESLRQGDASPNSSMSVAPPERSPPPRTIDVTILDDAGLGL